MRDFSHATSLSSLQICFLPTVCVKFGVRVSVSLLTSSFSALVLCAAHSICPYGLIPALASATWHAWYSSKVRRFLVLHACTSDSRFCQLISEKGLSGWLAYSQISMFQRRRCLACHRIYQAPEAKTDLLDVHIIFQTEWITGGVWRKQ